MESRPILFDTATTFSYTATPRLALTAVSTVELFATMARLARGQTLVSTGKNGAIDHISECKKCCMQKFIAPMGIEDI